MRTQYLQVLHLSKEAGCTLNDLSEADLTSSWIIETCQRILVVRTDDQGIAHPGWLSGKEAYGFLLLFICGLKSTLQGEADVLGQFKTSWLQWVSKVEFEKRESSLKQANSLRPWVNRLLQDAKEVRTRYLQNLGSQTYGCLSRQMIRNELIHAGNKLPLLILGAGQLAQTVTPMLWSLLEKEGLISSFLLWNRTPERINHWMGHWPKKIQNNSKKLSSLDELHSTSIAAVVSFLPDDPQLEAPWAKALIRLPDHIPIFYFGALQPQHLHWKNRARFFSLSDLLNSQSKSEGERNKKLFHAKRACEEKAKYRSIFPSFSVGIPHSWEDLPQFAH